MALKVAIKDPMGKEQSMLLFNLSGVILAIELKWIKEILPASGVVSLPNSVSHVAGMINVRGEIIPVIKSQDILAYERTEVKAKGKEAYILLMHFNNESFGLQVNEVMQLINVTSDNIFPFHDESAGQVRQDFVTQSITHEENVVVPVIDAHRIASWFTKIS